MNKAMNTYDEPCGWNIDGYGVGSRAALPLCGSGNAIRRPLWAYPKHVTVTD